MKSNHLYQRRNRAHARRTTPEERLVALLKPGQVRCDTCGAGVQPAPSGRLRKHVAPDGLPCPNRRVGDGPVFTGELPEVEIPRERVGYLYQSVKTPPSPLFAAKPLTEPTGVTSRVVTHAAAATTPAFALCGAPVGEAHGSLADVMCRRCRSTKAFRAAIRDAGQANYEAMGAVALVLMAALGVGMFAAWLAANAGYVFGVLFLTIGMGIGALLLTGGRHD